MPLLGKQPFLREKLPEDIDGNDEVFYCKTTNEAFTTYDEFFERQILCSSMVWTCAITGKTGLTYDEAVQSETNANNMLTSVSPAIQLPVIYLMNNYINESKFGAIVDMIYAFISNRYFVNEEVDININSKKVKGKIMQVIPPPIQETKCKHLNKDNAELFGTPDTNLYRYSVAYDANKLEIFATEKISRIKGSLNKDKVRLFLKQHITSPKRFQNMQLNSSSKIKYNIEKIKWTDIYAGPEPIFSDDNDKNKSQDSVVDSKFSKSKFSKNQENSVTDKSKKKESNSSQSINDDNASRNVLSLEDKQKQRQELKQQKIEQKMKEKELKKQYEEEMKEWSAKRDDLACDDLLALPTPTPLKCDIPIDLFGDTLVVMEFLHSFNNLFDLKSVFPNGVTIDLMELVLNDNDIHGPFGDLLRIMLTTIFTLQEDEEKNDKEENSDDDEPIEDETKPSFYDNLPNNDIKLAIKSANNYINWFSQHLGLDKIHITLDPFNLSEVLRIHLLSSGGGKSRLKNRGLYYSREDPGLWFVIENSHILSKLEFENIYELNSEERLKILHVLIHQVLVFVAFRDHVDTAFEEISKLKRKIRDIQAAFSRWTKDNAFRRNIQKKEVSDPKLGKDNAETNTQTDSSHTQSVICSPNEQIEDYKREKTRKEEEMYKECSDIRAQISKLQSCYCLKPIGFDRAYRRYWIFESIPGLFVEHLIPDLAYTDLPFGTCLSEPTPVKSCKPNYFEENQSFNKNSDTNLLHENKDGFLKNTLRDDSSTSSDKENDTSSTMSVCTVNNLYKESYLTNYDRCTANTDTCYIHGLINMDNCTKWAFYYNTEQLDVLIATLNNRGYRESELRSYLTQEKNLMIDMLNRCPAHKLNQDIVIPEVRKSQRLLEILHLKGEKANYSQLKPNIALESAVRDFLITMEERIFAGGLGHVNDISREKWRENVERSSDNKTNLINKFVSAIHTLALSVRSQCLSAFLCSENGCFDRWAESLKQSTSFSQLFLYLTVLEHSVLWSKSALKAYCKICRRKCDAENMLLCDACNRGHHTYCLKPPLDSIPRGEWYCPNCRPKFKPLSPRKPIKDKLIITINDDDSDYVYESETANSDSEQSLELSSMSTTNSNSRISSRSTTPNREYELCKVCGKANKSLEGLSCNLCSNFYHLNCTNMTRLPRTKWICKLCSREKHKRDYSSSDSDDTILEFEEKTHKKSRYSQDFDYADGNMILDETTQTQLTDSAAKRRLINKSSSLCNSMEFLNFSLCEDILKKLQKHEDGWLFRNKPSSKFAPNYNKIVKKYVDFGQLVSRLNMGHYRTNFEFFNDILLMFANCEFYWPSHTQEFKSGICLANYFHNLLNEYNITLSKSKI